MSGCQESARTAGIFFFFFNSTFFSCEFIFLIYDMAFLIAIKYHYYYYYCYYPSRVCQPCTPFENNEDQISGKLGLNY